MKIKIFTSMNFFITNTQNNNYFQLIQFCAILKNLFPVTLTFLVTLIFNLRSSEIDYISTCSIDH